MKKRTQRTVRLSDELLRRLRENEKLAQSPAIGKYVPIWWSFVGTHFWQVLVLFSLLFSLVWLGWFGERALDWQNTTFGWVR